MRALKFLVIVLGVVLVVGFAAVAVEIVRRAAPPERAAAPAGQPFAASLGLPAAARVRSVAATDARVVVQIIMPDGGDILYSFDPVTGAVAGTLRITEPE